MRSPGKPTRGELPPDPERIFAAQPGRPDADPAVEAARFRPAFAPPGAAAPGARAGHHGAARRRRRARRSTTPSRTSRWNALRRPRSGCERSRPTGTGSRSTTTRCRRRPRQLTEAQRRYLAALGGRRSRQTPDGGEAWQALIFDTARARELKPGDAFGAIYRAFLGRAERPARGLAARLAESRVRRRMRLQRGRGVSVGSQRLRDDAETIRKGAVAKGEDPELVDPAIALDEERRRVLGDVEWLRAQRKAHQRQVGAAMKAGGAGADELKARSMELGTRIEAGDERLRDRGAAGGPAAAHPQPA